jgi:serine/threonine protein phosphatase PrpC
LIANTGDSRCLALAGNETKFRELTYDHRVYADVEDSERVRLAKAKAIVKDKRVYPGGLACTRTIGDAAFSPAVVPTPDICAMSLEANQRYRFLMATDGLWDSLDLIRASTALGLLDDLASRKYDAKEATLNLMKLCMEQVGCVDDVTILIVDVLGSTPEDC